MAYDDDKKKSGSDDGEVPAEAIDEVMEAEGLDDEDDPLMSGDEEKEGEWE